MLPVWQLEQRPIVLASHRPKLRTGPELLLQSRLQVGRVVVVNQLQERPLPRERVHAEKGRALLRGRSEDVAHQNKRNLLPR